MIVVDTSAWVEFLRRTESPVHLRLRELITARARLAVTEVVVAELLAGAGSRGALETLRARLLAFPVLPLGGLAGFEAAVDVYRACRSGGEPVRSLSDCLVAAAAIEAGARLLHADRDFDVIERHTPLLLEPV